MVHLLAVAAGGALGAVARWLASEWIRGRTGLGFPWGTLGVNLSGCLLIGLAYGSFAGLEVPPGWRAFLTVGFLGAFTTFSTFGYETVNLVQQGHSARALGYVTGSVVGGFVLVLVGLSLGRELMARG
jgi:CrcB protein